MSLSRPVTKRPARVSSKSSKRMKSSSPQAEKVAGNIDTVNNVTSSPQAPQPDSGYYEPLDYPLDKSLPSYGTTNEDWLLFADEDVVQDDGYIFQDEDALDIASVKANHGSYINGHNNESFSSSLSYENGRFLLHVGDDNPRQREPTVHVFTNHAITREANLSTLQRWIDTHEQHEELAYYFEQLPQTVNCPEAFRQSRVWNENIDLSIYDIRN